MGDAIASFNPIYEQDEQRRLVAVEVLNETLNSPSYVAHGVNFPAAPRR
ncbi:MAG: hypothetical protein H6672_20415 [Anaerolineaceae bacterium]|nr:hypothetical protein [Anaerolineaceae bacterium]